ncbi:MAG: cytochrome b [Pseudomonadota bacterium]
MSGHEVEPRSKFHAISRLFHWGVAALILLQIPLAYQMMAMDLGPDKFSAYALHKSLGMTVFIASALRLAWRSITPPPALPSSMSARERLLARGAHVALYVVTLAMPIAGWCYSSAAAFSVSYFGLFTLPDLVPPSETLEVVFEWTHRLLAYALFLLLGAHLLAAGFHHWVRRDNVLLSMLPFIKLRS